MARESTKKKSNNGAKLGFAELLRGPYKPAQYGRVILPMTVLRRLDCVLEPTKEKVMDKWFQRLVSERRPGVVSGARVRRLFRAGAMKVKEKGVKVR